MHPAHWQLKCLLFAIYKYIFTADSDQGFIRHSYTITVYAYWVKRLSTYLKNIVFSRITCKLDSASETTVKLGIIARKVDICN